VGFQHLVTLNSDVLSEVPSGLKLDDYLLPQRLTDATLDGGLFGMRFEPPRGEQAVETPRRRRSARTEAEA
jgi:hypothetical protein